MNQRELKKLLADLRKGKVPLKEVINRLKNLPYLDLGFAKLDTHRSLRQGFPEVILGKGKTTEQLKKIIEKIDNLEKNFLVTKLSSGVARKILEDFPHLSYFKEAQILAKKISKSKKGFILILSAGTSDIPIAAEAAVTAEVLGNRVQKIYDVGVAGIHRLFNHLKTIQKAKVLIVVAGMEGSLPSVVGGLVRGPVIALPTSIGYGANLKGIAAFLTMLNSCSPNVATVNIDNGFGAGYLASLINQTKP